MIDFSLLQDLPREDLIVLGAGAAASLVTLLLLALTALGGGKEEDSRPDAAIVPGNFQMGLAKTREGLLGRMRALFSSGGLDEAGWEELEALLVGADIGMNTAQRLLGDLKKKGEGELKGFDGFRSRLTERLEAMVAPRALPLEPDASKSPYVILLVGVNGVGKTTTIGKLARRFKESGLSVMLAAGDTFRAGAIAQLEEWGERNDVPVVSQQEGSDAAAVIHDAVQSAKRKGVDVLIADTAGRLHTKSNLMEELKKVRRVLEKAHPGSPHEVLMALDATTGQNALNQLEQFHQAMGVTGIVMTKLDGTPRGGILVAVAEKFEIPFRFIGVGEKAEDLIEFDPAAYAQGLLAGE